MSEVTKFFNKSFSVTTDATVSTVVGAVGAFLVNTLLGFIPFIMFLSIGFGGTLAAMTYHRARQNLQKTDSGLS